MPDIFLKNQISITEYLKSRIGDSRVKITTQTFDEIISFPVPSFLERINRIIFYIKEKSNNTTETVEIYSENNSGATIKLLRDTSLATEVYIGSSLDYLENKGFIKKHQGYGWANGSITVDGYLYLESRDKNRSESRNAVVAMWFSSEMNDAYSVGMAPAISDCGYDPIRIDSKEHNNKIDDEIVSEIRRAKFLVSDYSCGEDGARGGVYFEAGLALGLNIPVIFCVRSADLRKVHFDTRQFSHIVWDNPEDLRVKLTNRIRATIV